MIIVIMPKPQIFSWSLKLHWQLNCVSGIVGLVFFYFAERIFPFILVIYITNLQFSVDQYYTVLCGTQVSLPSKNHTFGAWSKAWQLISSSSPISNGFGSWLVPHSRHLSSNREPLSETRSANYIADGACPFILCEKLNRADKTLKPALHHLHRKLQLEPGLW